MVLRLRFSSINCSSIYKDIVIHDVLTNNLIVFSPIFPQDGLNEFVYVLFMVIILIAIIFVYFFVPETKGKSFEEVAQALKLGGRASGQSRAYGVNADEMTPMDTSKV